MMRFATAWSRARSRAANADAVRILVVNQYFHPDAASSAQILTELCEDLSVNHDVWVVCATPSYNVQHGDAPRPHRLRSQERHGRIRVVRMWSTSFHRSSMLGRVLNYVTFLFTAGFGALRVPKPDVVMTWTDPPPVAALGAILSKVRRVPYVLSCQDIVPESVVAAGELSNRTVIKMLTQSRDIGFRGASRIVSIGHDMEQRLVALGVPLNKIVTIRNWSDGTLVRPLTGPNPFRDEMGWGDKFVVMHSGNLGMGQDLGALLEAAQILQDDPEILFAIVGDGMRKEHWLDEVRRRDIHNVTFVPFQPKENLPYSLGAADIHVVAHTLGMEGFQVPSKLYGMLAAGLPCLAVMARDSEVATTILEAGCGLVADPTDPQAVAVAIRQLKEQDTAEMGRRARGVFEERFDRPIATAEYERLLLEVVAV